MSKNSDKMTVELFCHTWAGHLDDKEFLRMFLQKHLLFFVRHKKKIYSYLKDNYSLNSL